MRDGQLRWTDLLQMAQTAEAIGIDSFWLPDHLLFKNEGAAPHGPWEAWSLLSALAATTSKMELGTAVLCTTFRNPALLAKMADTVDEISGGRLILGLGAGWHEPEYQAFGYPFDHRFERFKEAVTIIKTLLREGQIDFDGTYYQARECELRPRGPRSEGPPILIGALATKPRMLKLVATFADMWNGWLVPVSSHADQVPALREAVDAACAVVGRDPSTLRRSVGISVDQRPGPREASVYTAQHPLSGTPEEIAAELRAFEAQGIEHIQLALKLDGLAGIEALAPVIEAYRASDPLALSR
jgi:alkanesulfonate monooxygenase SsuD/methylene tetrahydromethanopterin reductase-like flavin-dependent oxidoreductase (luciferase family)